MLSALGPLDRSSIPAPNVISFFFKSQHHMQSTTAEKAAWRSYHHTSSNALRVLMTRPLVLVLSLRSSRSSYCLGAHENA